MDRWEDSPGAEELAAAVAVRVHVLLRTVRRLPGLRQQRQFTHGSQVFTPPMDGYQRRYESLVVTLANVGRRAVWVGE